MLYLAGLLLFTQGLQANEQSKREQPNIIFIFADDWGMGDLASHGHPYIKTPTLDQLAKQGTDFMQFTVNSPVCSPSRTAVMTGKYPARNQVHQHFASEELNKQHDMPDWLPADLVMMPRILQQAGYKTAHYGKWHLSGGGLSHAPKVNDYGYDDSAVWVGPTPDYKGVKPALLTTSAVNKSIGFIERNRTSPFFINLWIHESHAPIKPTIEMKARYPETPEPYKSYYAVITEADKQIGRLLQRLKELKLDENTLIIFSSDNGPELPKPDTNSKLYNSRGSSGGLRGQKRSLMQGGVNVPFIVRWPGKTPANTIDHTSVITAVDLLPTFTAIAKAKLPAGFESDGEDVTLALTGGNFKRAKPVFWDWRGFSNPARDHWAQLGMRRGDWKLLADSSGKRIELFNIARNRFQQNDLKGEHPEIAKTMKAELMRWQKELPVSPYYNNKR